MTGWRPTSGPDVARRRAALLDRARAYLRDRDVLPVDTPALSRFMNTDPALDSFRLRDSAGRVRYLHTSPEFCMKRLLAAGYPDIYSICRVFRDGESGRRHQPEFTMLEWYRHGFGLDRLIEDTVALVATCLDRATLRNDVLRLDYASALERFAGIDAFAATIDELALAGAADARLRDAIGDDRDAWLDLLLETRVIGQFDPARITVLAHFPASKAALARLCPADARVADRFELFLGGHELANGYVELTDAAEQRQRIDAEFATRQRTGRAAGPADDDLLAALDAGLPDCAGVALGIERLHMVYDGTDRIADVVTFSTGEDDA